MTSVAAGRGALLRRIHNALRSRNLTIVLMLAIGAAGVLSLIYPQAGRLTARELTAWTAARPVLAAVGRPLGAHNVFVSWWFLIGAALLFVNAGLCTIEQVDRAVKLTRKRGFAVSARMVRAAERHRIATSALSADRVADVLRGTLAGAHVHVRRAASEGRSAMLGVSRGWSQWGSAVFHLALLLTLVSVVLVSLTEAEGGFRVTVGGGFSDKPGAYGRYARGPWGPASLGGWSLYLERFEPRHRRGDFIPGPASSVVVTARDGTRRERADLTRGEYFDVDGTNVFQSAAWGFAPVLDIRDASGETRTGAVLMQRWSGTGRAPTARFDVGGRLNGTAQPLDLTASIDAKPRLKVKLLREGQVVVDRTLAFGQEAKAGGYTVAYTDFRYWSEFLAVRNPWLSLVNIAFWLAVGGLSVMYLWPTTYAWALVDEEEGRRVVYMGGRREKYSRDFAELVEKTKKALTAAELEGT